MLIFFQRSKKAILFTSLLFLPLIFIISGCGDKGNPTSSNEITLNVPSTFDFGAVLILQSKQMNIPIENTSSNGGSISVSIDGPDKSNFNIVGSTQYTLSSKTKVNLSIEFLPTTERKYSATLTISFNTEQTKTITLTGDGTSQLALDMSPVPMDFGKVDVGSNKSIKLAVRNVSATTFSLSPAISGGDSSVFAITYKPTVPLTTAKVDSVVVKFSPTWAKPYSSVLYLDSDRKYSVQLTGSGQAVNGLQISTQTLDFGALQIGNTKDLSITIKNVSSNNLSVNVSLNATGFAITNQPAGTIPPDGSGTLTIRFTPTEIKNYAGTATLNCSDGSTYIIDIKGAGASPQTLSLDAAYANTAPIIDGSESDPIWANAQALSLTLNQVESTNMDKRTISASIKALYDNEYIYFLVKVKDDSRDDSPNTFIFKGGDASDDKNWSLQTNGQDGISFMFPTTSNVQGDDATKTFDKVGCSTTCHITKSYNNYEGGSFPTKGTVDIWYWKAGTTDPQGYADDYFACGSDGKYPLEKRGDEPGNSWGDPNFRPTGTGANLPVSVADGNNNNLDMSKFIWDATSSPFSASNVNPATGKAWANGDKVPGWKLETQTNPFTERADIQAKGSYSGGYWTVEFKRKLDTQGSNNSDVVIAKGTPTLFSFAYFDNSRMWADFEYLNLGSAPRPGHWGTNPYVLTLNLK